jgi:hypothetical protein
MKRAQAKYRLNNRQQYLDYNKKVRLKYYHNTKNYRQIDDMRSSFARLFRLQ